MTLKIGLGLLIPFFVVKFVEQIFSFLRQTIMCIGRHIRFIFHISPFSCRSVHIISLQMTVNKLPSSISCKYVMSIGTACIYVVI